MRKQWFDKRAEDGGYWTVIVREESNYNILMWEEVTRTWYEPIEFIKVKRRPTMGGKMTKEEAIAMAKLLNATLGESK